MGKENLDEVLLEENSNDELNSKEIEKEIKKENRKKRSKRFFKICSIVVDILVVPVIIFAFVCTILTFSAKANNEVPSIFGMSIVAVVSPSMEPEHPVGDVLVIKSTDPDNLKVGDKIAFYSNVNSVWYTEIDGVRYSKVIFHQIVRIAYSKEGVRHFVCMGTNVSYTPNYLKVNWGDGDYRLNAQGKYEMYEGGDYVLKLEEINEEFTNEEADKTRQSYIQYITDEYVVGVYDSAISPAFGGFIKFCSSTTGMICLVIAPALLLILLTIAGLSKEVKQVK
ncbi:MAG: hypothetical protein IJW25_02240, partial [Clostridia bacterium]|nr:hypothetical protein [Clostridia bacterium]